MKNKSKWHSEATGDMTLSVLDENGKQILKIDMLAQNTMKANLGGDKLAKAFNDLTILSAIPDLIYDSNHPIMFPHPDAGCSDLPWKTVFSTNRIVVKDCKDRKIAERNFPKKSLRENIEESMQTLEEGIKLINSNPLIKKQ